MQQHDSILKYNAPWRIAWRSAVWKSPSPSPKRIEPSDSIASRPVLGRGCSVIILFNLCSFIRLFYIINKNEEGIMTEDPRPSRPCCSPDYNIVRHQQSHCQNLFTVDGRAFGDTAESGCAV